MKKCITLRALLLVVALSLFLLAGCSKNKTQETTQPNITSVTYNLTHIDSGAFSYDADEFQASGKLQLFSDGTATLRYAEQTLSLLYDESNLWSADEPDVLHPYTISGKVLTLEYYTDILTFVEK